PVPGPPLIGAGPAADAQRQARPVEGERLGVPVVRRLQHAALVRGAVGKSLERTRGSVVVRRDIELGGQVPVVAAGADEAGVEIDDESLVRASSGAWRQRVELVLVVPVVGILV